MSPKTILALTLALASCTEKGDRPSAKTPAPPAQTIVVTAPPAAEDAGFTEVANPKRVDGDPVGLAYLEDGTLVIATDREVAVADGSGVTRRTPLRGRVARIDVESGHPGIVLEGRSDVALLETPSLREVYAGPGYALMSPQAIATAGGATSVLVQIGDEVTRLTLPPGTSKRVDSVVVSASGKYAVVTWSIEDTTDAKAAVFEAATGRMVGPARPMPLFSMDPSASLVGDLQVAVDANHTVVVLDLATAAVVRSAKVACPKDSFLGNPTTAPGAGLLLVTCGEDGIALDAKTLAPKRRYARILPGCDNGGLLPGALDPKAKNVLVLEGCGGIARLDLATGKYQCSDEIGLVGAPYEPMASSPGGRRAPSGREGLPPCTKDRDGTTMRVGTSGTYTLAYDEPSAIVHAAGRIELEPAASLFAMARDDEKIAYVVEGRVIVRSLPAGTVVQEIATRPPAR